MADVRNSLVRRRCSFCGKSEDQVHRLIAGPGKATICGQCVQLCHGIMTEKRPDPSAAPLPLDALPTPQRIMEQLNQYVIGQDRAKKVLSVAVYNHYKRVAAGMQIDDVELGKSNILLLGPTGSGKTLLAQTLARILDVPFCIADATALTEAGYVGEDVESILLRLLEAAEFDVERAEKGIVYIDEIDKIARKSENPSLARDVSGEGVQQALLKIIEGMVANVAPAGGRKHPQQDYIRLNTANILFLCGGAFDGIEHIIAQRTDRRPSLGFRIGPSHVEDERAATGILPEDLLHFGLIPELIGRLPVIVGLDSLDQDDLIRILTEPKNALVKQYAKLLALDRVELLFTAEALDEIAAQALGQRTGARGLRTIVEEALLDTMFELPSRNDVATCIVTDRVILQHEPPLLETAVPTSAGLRAVRDRSA